MDASAIICGTDGRALSDLDFVFYNNLSSPTGAVLHQGDQLVGGDGVEDDEQIIVKLHDLPGAAASIIFVVSIDRAIEQQQLFGQVRTAFIRVVNNAGGLELARFALNEGASENVAIIFGEVYRDGAEWQFRAIGDGDSGGLLGIIRKYGIDA